MDALARALAFTWRYGDACADEVVRLPFGAALRSPSIVDAWSVNGVRVERGDDALTLDALAAEADAHAAGATLYLQVEDERTALRLTEDARAASGWSAGVELLMGLGDEVAEPRAAVREGTLDEVLVLLSAWLEEEGQAPRTIEHLLDRRHREHAAGPETLVVAEHDGVPAAMASLRLGSGVAQVEDVYARPAARGTGIGQAVTAAAARGGRASGARDVFIVADAEDWPKELYAKVGFAPLGRRANLHRPRASRG